jgi:hypothetical protein
MGKTMVWFERRGQDVGDVVDSSLSTTLVVLVLSSESTMISAKAFSFLYRLDWRSGRLQKSVVYAVSMVYTPAGPA